MAFTSLSDARTKLTNLNQDVNSTILYANNSAMDSTTTFYTNVEKTNLAPAGNYVIPTPQFKSYYVTLNSSGKIVGTAQELLESTTDVSWVDDSIIQYPQGIQVSNNYFGNWWWGTNMSLDSSNRLTDALWTQKPNESDVKKWQVDYAEYRTDALTNIDLSDMKGYDLKITIGKWGSNYYPSGNIAGFEANNFTFPIVHIAADRNRATTVGSLKYYFRPDYFFPKEDFKHISYFRRFPNTLPILDKNGYEKNFISVLNPILDCVVKDSGQFNPAITRTFRTSTYLNKGYNYKQMSYFKNFVNGSPSNTDYFMRKDLDPVRDSNNIFHFVPINKRHVFDGDSWIKAASGHVRGITPDFNNPTDVSYICALLESLAVLPDDRADWRYSVYGVGSKTYAEINPYEWTLVPYEGSYNYVAPATLFLNFFNPNGTADNPVNASTGIELQFDFEYVAGFGRDSFTIGSVYKSIWDNCKAYSIAQNWQASGGVYPRLSNYAEGLYQRGYYGNEGDGFFYVIDRTVNEVKATGLYDDYKNYYLLGTKSKSSVYYHRFYEAAAEIYSMFYVANYVNMGKPNWLLYAFVHNYDITRKLLVDILGVEAAKTKKVMGYFWALQEPNNADFYYARTGVQNGTMLGYRPSVAPSMNQSLAVWSFAYGDGLYLWSPSPMPIGGEYNHDRVDNGNSLVYYWGDLGIADNGLYDWFHIGYWQVMQNRDIVGASTSWLKPQIYWNGSWTSDTDANNSNIPVMLAQAKAPISAYKVSADGSEALLIITNPFNNGYTKATHQIRLPHISGTPTYSVDTWGQYTSVIRITL